MSEDDKRDDNPDADDEQVDAVLGGTVMMESTDEGLGGTVALDEAPAVAPDGTVLIGSDDNPAAAGKGVRATPSTIEGRKSSPPALPGEDTSLPPELGPTPAPPQASELTFDRSKLGESGEDTAGASPAPAKGSFFKPAVAAQDVDEQPKKKSSTPPPLPAEPAPAAPKPQPSTTATATKTPAKKPAAKGAAAPDEQPAPGTAPKAAPAPAKRFPLWAQLLALVVVAGVVGHFVARMQTETTAPSAPPPKPKPKPKAKPEPEPKPTATAPRPTAVPAPTPKASAPAPAPAPAPQKAADMSACVAKELGATLPSDKLGFVCDEADANRAQRDMSALLATAAEDQRDARGEWNKLAWYRMAKLQIVRTRCCGDARPLGISEALSACGLNEALTAIHEADRQGKSYDEPTKAYAKAVDCLFKANTMRMFGIIARPSEYQRQAFIGGLSSP